MSFQEIRPLASGPKQSSSDIKLSISNHRLKVYIGRGFAARCGWKAGSRISIARGVDTDFGKLRLSRSPSGFRIGLPTATSRYLVFSVPAWNGLVEKQAAVGAEDIASSGAASDIVVDLRMPAEFSVARTLPPRPMATEVQPGSFWA